MISATEAINRLQEGNKRFSNGIRLNDSHIDQNRRNGLLAGQEPFAIILGCSDSRAPVEIIFDQGLGDLFVIRVAGHIVTPSILGSIEYGVEVLGARLVVVLGHSLCGAVTTALEDLADQTEGLSPNLREIVDSIQTAVSKLMETEIRLDMEALVRRAVRENVRASVKQLQQGSRILKEKIAKGGLMVVGAEYSLETGEVAFLENLSEAS